MERERERGETYKTEIVTDRQREANKWRKGQKDIEIAKKTERQRERQTDR